MLDQTVGESLSFLNTVLVFLSDLTRSVLSFWWLFIPIVLFFIGLKLWQIQKTEEFKSNIDWTLLEITAPKDQEKTPKAMEQIFAAVSTIDTKVKPLDKWLKGKVGKWISFEIAGRDGSIHFLIRTPSDYRNLVESSIYAQYPEAQIRLVPPEDDYVTQFADTLPNEKYDIAGAEFVLKKEDGYPIRTYEYFEDKDEKRIDPISAIVETMSKLEPSEAIWLQILLRPADDDWVKEGEKLVEKLWKNKKDEPKKMPEPFNTIFSIFENTGEFIKNFIKAWFEHPEWGEKKEEEKSTESLTPGKKKIIEAIENKISKLGFDSAIRFVYIDRKDRFTKSNISSVVGALSQFNTNNLNKLDMNKDAMKVSKFIPKEKRELLAKKQFYSNYLTRDFPKKTSVFNTEELATLYHFPLTDVKTPRLQRTDFKRGAPPTDLPTINE